MGRPSKFTEARRQRILAILAAGGSRRSAAAVSGISPGTLTDWLKRGERVPGGRYGEFRQQALEAESGTHRLVGLPADEAAELPWAYRVLSCEEAGVPRQSPNEQPTVITLTFDDPPRGLSS